MGLLFVLIILASGYVFSLLHLPAGYRLRSTDGWVSYFHVGAIGLFFTSISGLIVFFVDVFNCFTPLLNYFNLNYYTLSKSGVEFSTLKLAGVAVISLATALLAGFASFIYLRSEVLREKLKRRLLLNNPFESILLSSLHSGENGLDVLITLDNDKVYVGRVVDHSIEHGLEESFAIVPFLSGYRGKSGKSAEFSVNYLSHYIKAGLIEVVVDADGNEKLRFSKDKNSESSLKYFKVVIVKERVVTISYFDVDVYIKLQLEDDPEEVEEDVNDS